MRAVPLIDMTAAVAELRPAIDEAIKRVLDSGVFVGGPEVAAFERELAATLGVKHAIGVSSGTDALHATLLALGIGPGDEVVTTPFTFFATAGSAARLGAKLVFADVDPTTLCLDPDAALAACSARTRAVIPVHLFGHPATPPVVPWPVVEDAAQSIGGPPLGGIAATLSFFPTKNIGALGDAGAVITDDAALADRLALVRNHGARPKYHHVALGGNFRLDALHAAVLRVKLPQLARWTRARRVRARLYRDLFAAAAVPPELRLPAEHLEHVYHQFVIRAPRRDELRAFLAERAIGTEIYYPEPLHLQPCFEALGYRAGSLPNAEAAAREVLALPIHPYLQPADLSAVVDAVVAFYRSSR